MYIIFVINVLQESVFNLFSITVNYFSLKGILFFINEAFKHNMFVEFK